jgi:hypothetical protein
VEREERQVAGARKSKDEGRKNEDEKAWVLVRNRKWKTLEEQRVWLRVRRRVWSVRRPISEPNAGSHLAPVNYPGIHRTKGDVILGILH